MHMQTLRIPASSGNVGVGFDSTGLSISLYNEIDFAVAKNGKLTIEQATGENIPCNAHNLVYKAAQQTASYLQKELPPLFLRQYNHIPLASGLGSSAACIVGGIMIADALLGGNLSKADMLKIATKMEGHPDNAAPVIYGGVCISQMEQNGIFTYPLAIKESLSLALIIPNTSLATKKARSVLPGEIPVKDAVHNIACMGLLVSALLQEEYALLEKALDDRLHQPYRKELIPNFDTIIAHAKELGAYGACLSGAGPTMLAFIDTQKKEAFAADLEKTLAQYETQYRVLPASIDLLGAHFMTRD
jgi:homoserine kinase